MKKGFKHSEESKLKMRQVKLKNPTRYWLGKKNPHSEKVRKNMSLAKKGKIPKNINILHSLESRKKAWLKISGKNNYNWKGGIGTENLRIRNGREMQRWRKAIFQRDDYRCLDCGERGGELNADHIFPFSKYPRLRFMLENGQTLCKNCHKQKTKMDYDKKYIIYV